MERAKNLERREVSDETGVRSRLRDLSIENGMLPAEQADDSETEDELPENMVLSFSTGTDDDILQKEYDMLSSSSMNDFGEERDDHEGDPIAVSGVEGEVLNGVYFDKLELELNAIEQAMSQFEGRLDLLREQAQDLLTTLQSERLTAAATDDLKSPSAQYEAGKSNEHPNLMENGSGDDC